MKRTLLNLLESAGVSPKASPVLVSLLAMAAQGAGIGRKGGAGTRKALARGWRRVVASFGRAVSGGITDAKLRAAMPFPGLCFTDEFGWKITSSVPLTYRDLIADALDLTANRIGAVLKPFEIKSVDDLRRAILANRLPAIEATLRTRGKLYSEFMPGRRLIIKHLLHGRSVFSLVEADQFGRLSALTHERSNLHCLKYHAKNRPKS